MSTLSILNPDLLPPQETTVSQPKLANLFTDGCEKAIDNLISKIWNNNGEIAENDWELKVQERCDEALASAGFAEADDARRY